MVQLCPLTSVSCLPRHSPKDEGGSLVRFTDPLTRDLNKTRLSPVRTIKISEAKRNFTRVFARAKRGEVVILQNGDDLVQLVPWVAPEPLPFRPAGYFAADTETVHLRNTLGEESAPGQ